MINISGISIVRMSAFGNTWSTWTAAQATADVDLTGRVTGKCEARGHIYRTKSLEYKTMKLMFCEAGGVHLACHAAAHSEWDFLVRDLSSWLKMCA